MPQKTEWPAGSSQTSALVRCTDWAATPLGPSEAWPASRRTIVDMLLACQFPMVALWGPELVQIYNDGYAEIMGSKHPAGMGQPTAACWPEVWPFNEPVYREVLQGKTVTFDDQLFAITRHGVQEDAYFTLCYSPLRDEEQTVAGILVTVFEITERVHAEATLQSSERLAREREHSLRAFLEATSDAVYRMSPDWQQMRSLDGRSFLKDTANPSASWWETYIPEEARPAVMKAIDTAIRTKGTFDLKHPVIQREGEIAWTHSRAVPVLDEHGEIAEWVGAATDISALLEAKKLRDAVVERDTLLAEVHHRVKNNLQVITSMLEMQARRSGDARSAAELEQACNRVSSIAGIHELLYGSKSYAEVDLLRYARKLVPHLLRFYGKVDQVEMRVEGETATLELERAVPFGLLLNEVVSNACKHAFRDGRPGHLNVVLAQTPEELSLDVMDDGVGLPAGFVYQSASTFGLQIVDTLAEQLNGKVSVVPATQGTHVQICLPKRRGRRKG